MDVENKSNDQFIQKKFDERDEQILRLVQKHQKDMETLQKETERKLEIKFKQLISKLDLEKIISN